MTDRPRSWGAGFRASGNRSGRQLSADLTREIATTRDGRDITQPWVQDLQEARDPRLLAAADWGVYERVRLDDQVKSCMEQRIRAVVDREWDVLPGDEADARSIAAAEALTAAIARVGWDRVTEKMLWSTFYGYQVAELVWAPIDGLLQWSQIRVRHARRFRVDADNKLRMLTRQSPRGELLPDRKFWKITSGGTDDDTPYGQGLAEWLYWPTLFKRNGIRFWNIFLDKFSVPTGLATYPRGATQAEINKALAAVQAIANDSGIVVPEGFAIQLLQYAQSGADFGAVCRYMDGAIAKIILSQTMTTDNGSSRSQSETHADVKLEVVGADADLLSDSFNADDGPARWFTDLNFGTDVASPRVIRIVEEEDDLKEAADTDETLSRVGWRRTEESFKDRYGDGYERAEPRPVDEAANPARLEDRRATPAVDTARDANVVRLPTPKVIGLAEAIVAALGERDVVDDAVDAVMADEGWREIAAPIVDPLLARIQRATSWDDVQAILSDEAASDSEKPLVASLARAAFASRIDALTDHEGDAS